VRLVVSGGAGKVIRDVISAFVGSGARTGTMSAPTATMRETLTQARTDLAAIEKALR
jgi:hypothetical protein